MVGETTLPNGKEVQFWRDPRASLDGTGLNATDTGGGTAALEVSRFEGWEADAPPSFNSQFGPEGWES